jgi:hypothetical protein
MPYCSCQKVHGCHTFESSFRAASSAWTNVDRYLISEPGVCNQRHHWQLPPVVVGDGSQSKP